MIEPRPHPDRRRGRSRAVPPPRRAEPIPYAIPAPPPTTPAPSPAPSPAQTIIIRDATPRPSLGRQVVDLACGCLVVILMFVGLFILIAVLANL